MIKTEIETRPAPEANKTVTHAPFGAPTDPASSAEGGVDEEPDDARRVVHDRHFVVHDPRPVPPHLWGRRRDRLGVGRRAA